MGASPLVVTQRIRTLKSRMREICKSGSVGDLGRQLPRSTRHHSHNFVEDGPPTVCSAPPRWDPAPFGPLPRISPLHPATSRTPPPENRQTAYLVIPKR
jgi:hypothetical protein